MFLFIPKDKVSSRKLLWVCWAVGYVEFLRLYFELFKSWLIKGVFKNLFKRRGTLGDEKVLLLQYCRPKYLY